MKKLILCFFAFFATGVCVQAHCGSCSMDAKCDDLAHKSSCSDEQLKGYFMTQEALAGDNLAAAKEGAKAFIAHAEEMSCSGESCETEISSAQSIFDASDIAGARVAFKSWSDALLAKYDDGGLGEGKAYKMHCPMAFNNTGGTWLQASKELRNPYYGSMMLTCGMQTGSYGGVSSDEATCSSGSSCCSEKKDS